MERYVVKRPAGDAGGGGGKRPRAAEPVSGKPPWQEIRAPGLDCDYRMLFGKAEADEIFRQLEEQVEYFEDTKMVRTTLVNTGMMRGSWCHAAPLPPCPLELPGTLFSGTVIPEGKMPRAT
ncbi:DNA oxidative demethylase ALKBH2 isoform X2 [Calypte anna]|uniref:DNA oxidative demethylase ALKBH2 isoform X2 n=1 Tax=Calypte anna TaxID=9244 RepID=UPI0011C47E48|nr:DNA oxidative demethylase ALKBH2 isoform X2 [Calypte anna]